MYDYYDNKKIFDKFKPQEIAVRIGEHNLANINGVGETGIEEWRNIQHIHIHPDYPIKDDYIGKDLLGKHSAISTTFTFGPPDMDYMRFFGKK